MFNLVLLILKLFFLALLYLFLVSAIVIIYRDLFSASATEEASTPYSACLKGIKGPQDLVGKTFLLTDETVIGRSSAADVILEDPAASHRHARIFTQGSHYFLEDLGSTNGTFVEDTKIAKSVRLKSDDKIRIGHTILQFAEKK